MPHTEGRPLRHLDTADVNSIREYVDLGIVDGVTTNPSLVAKTGKSLESVALEICELVNGPISIEAVSTATDEIIAESRRLAAIHPNVVVKIPMIKSGLQALSTLSAENINARG